jgi:hypothetical protein
VEPEAGYEEGAAGWTTLIGIFTKGSGGYFDLVVAGRASADMAAYDTGTTTMKFLI